jgi:hypothetical protein
MDSLEEMAMGRTMMARMDAMKRPQRTQIANVV